MKYSVPHDLDLATARRVAEKAFESYREQFAKYRPTFHWDTERHASVGFTARGVKMTGTIDIQARDISFGLEVPLLLRPFRGRAIEIIEREITVWVEKAKAGAL